MMLDTFSLIFLFVLSFVFKKKNILSTTNEELNCQELTKNAYRKR